MSTVAIYTAKVSREGKWWIIRVPDLDAITQARRFAEVEDMTRSLIAVTLDTDPAEIELRLDVDHIEDLDVTQRLEQLRAERAAAADLHSSVAAHTRAFAREMAARGLTVRDIGAVLGVSFQRAQQLLDEQNRAS